MDVESRPNHVDHALDELRILGGPLHRLDRAAGGAGDRLQLLHPERSMSAL